jgi:hypothetical protein
MRLKSSAKVRVVGHMNPNGTVEAVNECSLDYHIKYLSLDFAPPGDFGGMKVGEG